MSEKLLAEYLTLLKANVSLGIRLVVSFMETFSIEIPNVSYDEMKGTAWATFNDVMFASGRIVEQPLWIDGETTPAVEWRLYANRDDVDGHPAFVEIGHNDSFEGVILEYAHILVQRTFAKEVLIQYQRL